MSNIIEKLATVLADTYALYLKTQNYHWHVKGPQFASLHTQFEGQYTDLATAVDEIAERIVILGGTAPATFTELDKLKTLTDGKANNNAEIMIRELAADQDTVIKQLNAVLELASNSGDEGTVALVGARIAVHEKHRWMLSALLG